MKRKLRSQLWVVKVGSAVFMDGGPILLRAWMQQVARLQHEYRTSVIWVTSGAISSARSRTKKNWKKLPEKQALSAIGQSLVMDQYNLALQSLGLIGAQVLLTYDDMNSRKRRHNLQNTLRTLLSWGIVPILNENDAVATEEIQFGDNDTLSARVAALVGADRLIMMTNVDGLYDGNPKNNSRARLIHHVAKVTPALLNSIDRKAVSGVGTGGMYSKLKAAKFAQKSGIPTWLMRGDQPNGLIRIYQGDAIGTQIGGKQ